MLSRRMPWEPVPCRIWVPTWSEQDAYGNSRPVYATQPTIETTCCYAPGYSAPQTSQSIEEDRPQGDYLRVAFFLPKTVNADLRHARIACVPPDDATLAALTFDVVGDPISYPRASTPGDYSWYVEGVANLG